MVTGPAWGFPNESPRVGGGYGPPGHYPQQMAAPPAPPTGPAARAYLDAVAQHMGGGGLRISQAWIGPVHTLLGIGAVIESSLNPVELAICVGQAGEVSPATVAGFTRQVDEFARSLRRPGVLGVKGGACAVAALVSERVQPVAYAAVTNKAMSFGAVVVPAVVDLGQRQLIIAANTPMMGWAMWGTVRSRARAFLPEPRAVLG